VLGLERDLAVDLHQARAGQWSRTSSYLHRIGRALAADWAGCSDLRCPAAAVCTFCDMEADTPRKIILVCPTLAATRTALLGAQIIININDFDIHDFSVVSKFISAFLSSPP
jgi:hypothetical protein